jgi:hypothetical protein
MEGWTGWGYAIRMTQTRTVTEHFLKQVRTQKKIEKIRLETSKNAENYLRDLRMKR